MANSYGDKYAHNGQLDKLDDSRNGDSGQNDRATFSNIGDWVDFSQCSDSDGTTSTGIVDVDPAAPEDLHPSGTFQHESKPEDGIRAEDDTLDTEMSAGSVAHQITGDQKGPVAHVTDNVKVMMPPSFNRRDINNPILPTGVEPSNELTGGVAGPGGSPAVVIRSGLAYKKFMPRKGKPLVCGFPGCQQGRKIVFANLTNRSTNKVAIVLSRPDLLRRHIKSVHTGENQMKCSKCHRSFSRQDNCKKHQKKCRVRPTANA